MHQAEAIRRAILHLHAYIDRKTRDLEEIQSLVRNRSRLNHRQVAILGHAMRYPGALYTIEGHPRSHDTVYDTARRDLLHLTEDKLFTQTKRGRAIVFIAVPDVVEKLKRRQQGSHFDI